MRHSTHDASCAICALNSGETPVPGGVVFENALWLVRHVPAPYGVAGWMMLHTQRHVAGPAHFDDAEAASFGPTLRHLERVLEDLTGALRIYTVVLGESFPHFHGHMVPRYARMPNEASAFGVFDLLRQAGEGTVNVDVGKVEELTSTYRARLATDPPPTPP